MVTARLNGRAVAELDSSANNDELVEVLLDDPTSALAIELATYARVDGTRGTWDAVSLGAVGDGTTNDTTVLQGIADDIETAGGGTLLLPPGYDFAVTQLLLGDNTTLVFVGATLRRNGNSATSSTAATLRNKDMVGGNSNITIHGGTVIANSAAETGKHVAFDTVTGLHISDLFITRSYGDWGFFARDVDDLTVGHMSITGGVAVFEDGFHIEGCQNVAVGTLNVESGDDAVAIVQTTETVRPTKNVAFGAIVASSRVANIFKLEVDSTATAGISDVSVGHLVGDKSAATSGNCVHVEDQSAGKIITDINISGAEINGSGSSGYAVKVSYATDVTLSDVHITDPDGVSFDIDNVDRLLMGGCTTKGTRGATISAMRLRAVTEFELSGCRVTGATSHGFVIGASGLASSDGSVRGCVAGTCTGNGVHLDSATSVSVTSNRIKGCAWPVREEGASSGNYITGNDLRGNTQTAIGAGASGGEHNSTYRDGNFGVTNRILTFTSGDTTPTVGGRNRYYQTANAGATSITGLDDGLDGQEVVIFIEDANTTFVHSATLRLGGAVNWTATTNDTITFARVGSQWTELARSNT